MLDGNSTDVTIKLSTLFAYGFPALIGAGTMKGLDLIMWKIHGKERVLTVIKEKLGSMPEDVSILKDDTSFLKRILFRVFPEEYAKVVRENEAIE